MRRFVKGLYAAAASLAVSFFVLIALLAAGTLGGRVEAQEAAGGQAMKLKIPQSITSEHVELHEELTKAMKAGGETGRAAKAVADLLHPHFMKEEEYALPPLGLLTLVAEGKTPPEAGEVLKMTDRLKAELPQMLSEHRAIVAALRNLSDAAKKEGKAEYVRFAGELMSHAQHEEDVLYPAAIMVGEYLKLKSRS